MGPNRPCVIKTNFTVFVLVLLLETCLPSEIKTYKIIFTFTWVYSLDLNTICVALNMFVGGFFIHLKCDSSETNGVRSSWIKHIFVLQFIINPLVYLIKETGK